MSRSLARSERDQLCDLALELGPSAPTLCGDWNTRELVAHLVVRESSVVGAPGILLPGLGGLTERAMARAAKQEFGGLVARLRKARTPLALPGLDDLVNTLEFFVHHEDIRRAQHGWEPRKLSKKESSGLWTAIRFAGRGLVRPAGVPVTIRRSDTGASAVLRGGAEPVVITGPPSEVVLFLYGRKQTRDLVFQGPAERVQTLKTARLGI